MSRSDALKRTLKLALYVAAFGAMLAITCVVYYFATLYTPGPPQHGYLVLTGATALVGDELEPRGATTIVIRDGIIVQIGDDDELEPPPTADTLDLRGYTILPGLVDMHVHFGSPELDVGEEVGLSGLPGLILDYVRFFPDKRRSLLEHGVTSVRSLGDDHAWVMKARYLLQSGELEGPRLFAAGPMFTTADGHPVVTIGVDPESDGVRLPATPDEARRAVRELAGGETRVDLIKVIQERGRTGRPLEPIEPEVLRAIVEEAHEQDLRVTAHWGTLQDLDDVLAAGVDGLEHLEPRGMIEGWPEDVLQTLVDRERSITPTLSVLDAATRRTRSALPTDVLEQMKRRVGEFHAAGGRIVVGSDAGMPGVRAGAGVHRELELLVESGLSPQNALRSATSEAARVLGTDHIGAIALRRAADLVVVEGNPLRLIQAVGNIVMVIREGRVVVDRRGDDRG